MDKILDFLLEFFEFQKNQENKILLTLKKDYEIDENGDKYLKGMPFYSSLLYASETYQCYLKKKPFYCKKETEIIILAMKALMFAKIGDVKFCSKVNPSKKFNNLIFSIVY